jgi:hypothetical protein
MKLFLSLENWREKRIIQSLVNTFMHIVYENEPYNCHSNIPTYIGQFFDRNKSTDFLAFQYFTKFFCQFMKA